MSKGPTLPIQFVAGVLCCCACCVVTRHCSAAEQTEGDSVAASLREIVVKETRDPEKYEIQVHLQVSNQSAKPYCVLPTEFRLSYEIWYPSGEPDLVGGASTTFSEHARQVSDLELDSVVIEPGRTAAAVVKLSGYARPRGLAGTLRLEFRCAPGYKGDTYHGVPIYRERMKIRSEVTVKEVAGITKQTSGRQWVIRPVIRDRKKRSEESPVELKPTPCSIVIGSP